MGESALSLVSRLASRPPLLTGLTLFSNGGPRHREVIEVIGDSSTGKTSVLIDILAKCILARDFSGCGAHAVLIDCDHHFSIFRMVNFLKFYISKSQLNVNEKAAVKDSLSRLHIFSCYDSDSLIHIFYYLKRFLAEHPNTSLIAIDSLGTFYWQDSLVNKELRKMDFYVQNILSELQTNISNFYPSLIFTRSDFLKSSSSTCSENLNLGSINKSIKLCIKNEKEHYAEVISVGNTKEHKFKIIDNGILWEEESTLKN